MFDDLTFEEMRELDSRLFGGFCKADFTWSTPLNTPDWVEELADISNEADQEMHYRRLVARDLWDDIPGL